MPAMQPLNPTDPDIPEPDEVLRRSLRRRLVLIGIGGVVGAAARHGLDVAVGDIGAFPLSTFVENVVGAFLLGVVVVVIEHRSPDHPFRPFVVTGVLGSFTTFSTFAMAVVVLTDDGRVPLAVGYLVATLGVGLAAAALGVTVGRWFPSGGSR